MTRIYENTRFYSLNWILRGKIILLQKQTENLWKKLEKFQKTLYLFRLFLNSVLTLYTHASSYILHFYYSFYHHSFTFHSYHGYFFLFLRFFLFFVFLFFVFLFFFDFPHLFFRWLIFGALLLFPPGHTFINTSTLIIIIISRLYHPNLTRFSFFPKSFFNHKNLPQI